MLIIETGELACDQFISGLELKRWIFKSVLGKGSETKDRKKCGLLPNPPRTHPPVWYILREKIIFSENEPLMSETNFTLGPIYKSLYLLLLYQFTFAQNRPKSDISGANTLHYIKSFCNGIGGVGPSVKHVLGVLE